VRKPAIEYLSEGVAILNQVLQPNGSESKMGGSGCSSGGTFAFGSYFSGERRLELHYRYSLGLVTYHFGEFSLDHDSYMWAVLGSDGGSHYPGFSDEPLAPFEGLQYDLEHFGIAFLRGDKKAFVTFVKSAETPRAKEGLLCCRDPILTISDEPRLSFR
jgi:hypothetical protein